MNCIGKQIEKLLQEGSNNLEIIHIVNYIEMKSQSTPNKYSDILSSANYFIYQPFNKHHNKNPWYPKNIFQYLNSDCKLVKISYYRFAGFWLKPKYIPDRIDDINDINDIDNINDDINDDIIINNFTTSINKLKKLDNECDIKMFDFFQENYKNIKLFHDCFHPTNLFIIEMCKQITKIMKITFNENISVSEIDHNRTEINKKIKKILGILF